MLGDKNVYAVIAVKDMTAAKGFYTGILGMQILGEDPGNVILKSGDSRLLLYVSDYAGTNEATIALWEVDNVEAVVEELRRNGVEFEQYDDMEGVIREGDIHIMGETKAAWFKDPDGNILCVSNTL